MSSDKHCCVPGCQDRGGTHQVLHRFPNPKKDIKRFRNWLSLIGGDVVSLKNEHIYKFRRVCHTHFDNKYLCRNNNISNIAVPTLHMPGPISHNRNSSADRNRVQQISTLMEPTTSSAYDRSSKTSGNTVTHYSLTHAHNHKMSDGNLGSDNLQSPNAKKAKIDNEKGNGVGENQLKLKDFIVEKILNNNTNRKTVCVQGKFKEKSGVALAILEKNAFREEDLDENGYFSVETDLHTFFHNDIYGNYECFPRAAINGVKATFIHPATEKHIAKFSQQQSHIVLETPELYKTLTLPHIEKEQFNLQWVYNILEGKSEQDRIIHNNECEREGFVLLPDLKWDGFTKETLYLLAIVRQRGIKSLRDLDAGHLPLLRKVRDEGQAKIAEKYDVSGTQLRIYLHYQPSFYHLHIHFTYLRHEAPGIYAEKSHLLDTVINNLEMMGDYYKKASLPFTIREKDNIFNLYETNGHVQRIKSNSEID